MKLNQGNCHLLFPGSKYTSIWEWIGEVTNWESLKQELSSVVLHSDLTFNGYVSSLCQKSGNEPSVLARVSILLNFHLRKILIK